MEQGEGRELGVPFLGAWRPNSCCPKFPKDTLRLKPRQPSYKDLSSAKVNCNNIDRTLLQCRLFTFPQKKDSGKNNLIAPNTGFLGDS